MAGRIRSLSEFANPARFMRISGAALPCVSVLAALALVAGLGWGFFATPDEGVKVLTGSELPETMDRVVKFCVDYEIVGRKPRLAFGAQGGRVNLRFSPEFIEKVKARP